MRPVQLQPAVGSDSWWVQHEQISSVFNMIHIILMIYMRVSINGGAPIAGWCIVENPFEIDDLAVPPFQETSKSWEVMEF